MGVDSSEGRGQGQLLTLAAGPLQSIAGLRVTHKRESETSKKKKKNAQMKFTATFNPTRAFRKPQPYAGPGLSESSQAINKLHFAERACPVHCCVEF